MNEWNELQQMIDEAHADAEMLARKKETPKLLATADWLGRAMELEKTFKGLLSHADQLILERRGSSNRNGDEKLPAIIDCGQRGLDGGAGLKLPGGKARASDYRSAYFAREKKRGKTLTRIRSVYFKNEFGTILGITWKGKEKDKWFLNLQEGQFDEAVLICETGRETAQVIHLPKAFFSQYGRHMSRDEKGQIKFNVEQRGGRFYLQLPGYADPIDVMNYVDREPLICPHVPYV